MQSHRHSTGLDSAILAFKGPGGPWTVGAQLHAHQLADAECTVAPQKNQIRRAYHTPLALVRPARPALPPASQTRPTTREPARVRTGRFSSTRATAAFTCYTSNQASVHVARHGQPHVRAEAGGSRPRSRRGHHRRGALPRLATTGDRPSPTSSASKFLTCPPRPPPPRPLIFFHIPLARALYRAPYVLEARQEHRCCYTAYTAGLIDPRARHRGGSWSRA